jgi:hypothetical protein
MSAATASAIGGAGGFADDRAAPVSTSSTPGYDSGQKPEVGADSAFAKTAPFSSPAVSGFPSVADGQTDPEAKKPGHL